MSFQGNTHSNIVPSSRLYCTFRKCSNT